MQVLTSVRSSALRKKRLFCHSALRGQNPQVPAITSDRARACRRASKSTTTKSRRAVRNTQRAKPNKSGKEDGTDDDDDEQDRELPLLQQEKPRLSSTIALPLLSSSRYMGVGD